MSVCQRLEAGPGAQTCSMETEIGSYLGNEKLFLLALTTVDLIKLFQLDQASSSRRPI